MPCGTSAWPISPRAIPTCAGTSTISISCALISCSIPTGSMSWWHPTCLAISVGPGSGLHGHHRHRAVGQPESRAQVPIPVRARARFGARHHLRQGHRQSDRPDLERRADAGFPGLSGGIRRRRERDRDRAGGRTAHQDMQGTASTAEVGDAISSLISRAEQGSEEGLYRVKMDQAISPAPPGHIGGGRADRFVRKLFRMLRSAASGTTSISGRLSASSEIRWEPSVVIRAFGRSVPVTPLDEGYDPPTKPFI